MSAIQQVMSSIGAVLSVSFRYWQIKVYSQAQSDYGELSEFQWFNIAQGSIKNNPSTPVVSSIGSFGGYPTSNLTDGLDDDQNPWISPASPAFPYTLTFDMGSQVIIDIVYIWANGQAPNRAPSAFDVLASNDNISFTLRKSFSGVTGWTGGVAKSFAL